MSLQPSEIRVVEVCQVEVMRDGRWEAIAVTDSCEEAHWIREMMLDPEHPPEIPKRTITVPPDPLDSE